MAKEAKYLIDIIRDRPNFCVSSIDKVPLNVVNFLSSMDYNDIVPVKKEDIKENYMENNLATLNEIDDCPCFDKTNRAYHIQAAKDMIIGFDIEPRCDPHYLAFCANNDLLPAQYREYSMHMGIHLLYRLNPDKLSSIARQMLQERTEYKFKGTVDDKPFEYEIMMNNHWLTLTRNTFGKINDLSKPVPDMIYNLIERIASNWVSSKNKPVDYNLEETTEQAKAEKKAANILMQDPRIAQYQDLSVADYEDDDSKYEFNLALKIISQVRFRLTHPHDHNSIGAKWLNPDNPELQRKIDAYNYVRADGELANFQATNFSPTHVIWITSFILEQYATKREKWATKRDGLPWLAFLSKQAYAWGIHHDYWNDDKVKREIANAKANKQLDGKQAKPSIVWDSLGNIDDIPDLTDMGKSSDDDLNDLLLNNKDVKD